MSFNSGENNLKKSRLFNLKRWQKVALLLLFYDFTTTVFSYFAALFIRFDCVFSSIPRNYINVAVVFVPLYALVCLIIYSFFKLYKSVWHFASYSELLRLIVATFYTLILHVVSLSVYCKFIKIKRFPISYFVIGIFLQFAFMIFARFGYRFLILVRSKYREESHTNVLLYGAGSAGQGILRDVNHTHQTEDRIVCIIDDDPNKQDRFIDGVPIIGGRDELFSAVKKYNIKKIFIVLPSVSASNKRDILNLCQETGCEVRQLPGIYQLAKGDVTVSQMKKVSVEDLLGRDPIKTDMKEVFGFINGKVVLVTGGGGSIGSELCRQVAEHNPKQLIIFDVYENNAYEIQLELKAKYPSLDLVTLIGSVRDSRRMFQIFEQYRPDVVYHAAAHKHVPLMEDSPCESIKNNTIGTYKTAYAAMVHGCKRFVLISTDKAVNPTNIMGASKRLCEMVIQSFDKKIKEGKANELPELFTHEGVESADKDGTGEVFRNAKTEFVAVRFGNVLGSNGSVIPIFKKQIEKGGPVTVTHPDIIRYFMTISEAVSLVMQAGVYAHGGEIFVLDMGSPVKIDTLARNIIRLSGFKPDEDIKIEYTGLRPGEKLYEEKLMSEEGLEKTANELIHIGKPIEFDTDEFLKKLDDLMLDVYENDSVVREKVAEIVGTYRWKK